MPAQAKYAPMSLLVERSSAKGDYLRVNGSNRYRCLCGACHVVVGDSDMSRHSKIIFQLGTKLFLVLYVCLTAVGFLGLVGTLVWTLIPMFVTGMAVYAFYRSKYKYLYPFLLISVSLLC